MFDVAADGARRSVVLLVASHVLVQLVKRTVGRPRPAAGERRFLHAPDRFSFPSGHAAAALSVAIGYASVSPHLSVPLLGFAAVVEASRIVLGVHFPADVLAGQVIAIVTAAGVSPLLQDALIVRNACGEERRHVATPHPSAVVFVTSL